MSIEELIPLNKLCTYYKVDMSFFNHLDEIGLIEIKTVEQTLYLHPEKISEVEKIIRIYHDLEVNVEGIDIVFNLLQRINELQNEVNQLKNRLGLYEE